MKRCRWTLLAIGSLALAMGGLYECSTHRLRGWWNAEATYQGLPTSYWRTQINAWIDRFDSPEEAEKYLHANSWEGMLSSTIILYTPPRPTLPNRVRGWFGRPLSPDDDEPPEVLRGDEDAEPVLGELENDPAMRPCILRARKYALLRVLLKK